MTRIASLRNCFRPQALIIAICCATFVGCQSELELDLTPVQGKVLFKDQPLKYGSVMFQPEGNGPLARGTIQPDGTFVLGTESTDDGVRPRKCRVRITAFASQKPGAQTQKPGAQTSSQQELALGDSAIPTKYQSYGTSGVVVDIQPDMELPLIIELK